MRNKNGDTGRNIESPFRRTKSFKSVTSGGNKERNIWRSTSLNKIVDFSRARTKSSVLSSRNFGSRIPLSTGMNTNHSSVSVGDVSRKLDSKTPGIHCNSVVSIVLVEAKGLPPTPEDGVTHKIYCKFRLGTENFKTKSVSSTVQPKWGQRFILRLHKDNTLKVSAWDKGKQRNFMGSCILDLSVFETERTHDVWQQLDNEYGHIHLAITICPTSSSNCSLTPNLFNLVEKDRYIHELRTSWQLVGSLQVNIYGARGLMGKSNAYCTLELDNERVQTPKEGPSAEPSWNKCYVFRVYDVTSSLHIKVYGRSFTSALLYAPIGKVSIPLLTISNGEQRWYALKDRNKKYIAKGNCPRVLLQITLTWNPIKASLKLFRPKPVKYVKKPKKFDVALVYSNIEFVEKTFNFLYDINEGFKRLFEWDDLEYSSIALACWLVFCYYFRLWALPLLLLIPFTYYWLRCQSRVSDNKYQVLGEDTKNNNKKVKNLSGKLHDLQTMTLVITDGIEYIASVAEKLYNLVSFKVPFLSYLTMILLAGASLVFYFVPFNYLLMTLGIYKYGRKYLSPNRILNNDLIDFLSRIPDNKELMEWRELSVPEPVQNQSSSKLATSINIEDLKQ